MLGHRVRRAVQAAAVAFSFTFVFAIVALAEEAGPKRPGQFDFYVLALSWSPSYCEIAGNPDTRQCNET